MSELQFDFDALTIGDALGLLRASSTQDVNTFVDIADRYTIGGIRDMPLSMLAPALRQFATAFTAHCAALFSEPISPDVARILRQALGDSDA